MQPQGNDSPLCGSGQWRPA